MKNVAILDDYQGVGLDIVDWSPVEKAVRVTSFKDHLFDEGALVDRLKDFEIVVCMRERTPFPASLIAKLPKLEYLITTGMHNRSIDGKAATEHGVLVSGTGTTGRPTIDLTFGLILGLARSIPWEYRNVREGRWQETLGIGLEGKTLGTLGLGRLGSGVARVAQAFGMRVIAWSQNLTEERCKEVGVELADKDTLMAESDFVTIHLVLSDRTRGLIGAADIARMKPTAFLINTSRGPIVDEDALVEALRARRIAGAGVDVFETEPLPADHPMRHLDNALVTPHLGYVTEDNYRVYFPDIVDNIRGFLDGEPKRVIFDK